MSTNKPNTYTADNIQSLEGMEDVRLRPSMYIGGLRDLHHLAYEVVNNSIDEALTSYCNKVWVNIHLDNSISVKENGQGIHSYRCT